MNADDLNRVGTAMQSLGCLLMLIPLLVVCAVIFYACASAAVS